MQPTRTAMATAPRLPPISASEYLHVALPERSLPGGAAVVELAHRLLVAVVCTVLLRLGVVEMRRPAGPVPKLVRRDAAHVGLARLRLPAAAAVVPRLLVVELHE